MLAAQSALETKQTALETEYAALQANQTALEQEYAESQTAQTVLREDYAELLGNEAEVRENYAGLQDDFSRLEDRYSALRTDKAAIEAVSSNLAATLDIEAEVRRLQASSDIQYAAAFDAVQRFRDSADEPLGSITLAETAVRQLDSYIEGARALESKQQDLTGLVAVEHAAIYADSARLAQGKINQALYLRELVTGMSLNATVEQEYENALLEYRITGVAFTDDQKNAWQSDLDAALDQYQRAIDLLYDSSYWIRALVSTSTVTSRRSRSSSPVLFWQNGISRRHSLPLRRRQAPTTTATLDSKLHSCLYRL